MKIIKFIFLIFIVLSLMNCSDFLEEKSQDEVIVKTTTDFSEFLLGSGYPQPAITFPYQTLYLFDDDIELNENVLPETQNTNLLSRFAYFTWQPDMWERTDILQESYSGTYERLMGVNAVLDYIDEAIGPQSDIDIIKAEAFALRAFYYFQLVNIYGEPYNYNKEALGVPLKLTSSIVENGIRRSKVVDIYKQMVDDLENSIRLFEKYEITGSDYRLNLPTACILLSRVYLHMEKWDDAINAATDAIKYGGNLTDYTKIPVNQNFYLTDYDHTEVEWLYGANNMNVGLSYYFIPSQDLMTRFDNSDRRLDLYFNTNNSQPVVKHLTQSIRPQNVIRVSEAYLNRAEAYAQKGSNNEALADLNKLRENRIVGYQHVNISDNVLLNEIRVERRLELCFEEHRWFDLRRYGMPSITHKYKGIISDQMLVYTLKEKDPLYTIPIPGKIMESNILLEQNNSAYESLRSGVPLN